MFRLLCWKYPFLGRKCSDHLLNDEHMPYFFPFNFFKKQFWLSVLVVFASKVRKLIRLSLSWYNIPELVSSLRKFSGRLHDLVHRYGIYVYKMTTDIGQTMVYKTYIRSSNTNPTKIRDELRCSGRVSNSCSTSDTRRVNLVTNRW
jgi:hypothetical protein